METSNFVILLLLLNRHMCTSSVLIDLLDELLAEEKRDLENATNGVLSCTQPEGETPFSLYVTSVRISGTKVNRTTPPPYGFTEEEWNSALWGNYNYNVTTEVTYITTQPSHCTPDTLDTYYCYWPHTVPNIVWYVLDDDSNFTQTSVSMRSSTGEYTTTVTANNLAVIAPVTVGFSVQSTDLVFRYDHRFDQYNYKDNSFERVYSAITFHCYPLQTVRAEIGKELVLSWSFTIKPAAGETKEDLLGHRLYFRGFMLDGRSTSRPPHLYLNKLTWGSSVSSLSLEGTAVGRSGVRGYPYNYNPGKFVGEYFEVDDGYTVNLQLEFPADEVGTWMKGTFNLDVEGIKTVTHVVIDDEQMDNTTDKYYHQYNCPFDMDMLNVAVHYRGGDVSYERNVEAPLGIRQHNDAYNLGCEAYGCNIDKLELLKNGQPVHYRYQPHKSDNIMEQGFGAYKEIKWLLTHVNKDTFGTYECRVTDKNGNTTSRKIDMIAATLVKVKLLEWNDDYAVLTCRASGDPLPTLSFGIKDSEWNWYAKENPPISYSDLTTHTIWARNSFWTNEPTGLVTEATVKLTIPTDTLKDLVIVCKSHSVYEDKFAEYTMRGFPKSPEPWD